ncbi:MAG: succinate dehydrogenase, cytochrome b556 subunit [Gammaproteobacteria bacterium]|jgi:succinate dehydrogenase / fumarate reductase cytochrome b subunit
MEKVIYNKAKQRPKFINLLKIRMPITAVVSILHRISGLILFLVLPLIIYGLGLSLQGRDGFEQAILISKSTPVQLLIIFTVVSVIYHLLAGIRFLLIDIDIGLNIVAARWTAIIVILITVISMVLLVIGVTGL